MSGGGRASLNGRTRPKPNRSFEGTISHTSRRISAFMTCGPQKRVRLKLSWRASIASRGFATTTTGSVAGDCSSDHSMRCLRPAPPTFLSVSVGPTKPGRASGTVSRIEFSSRRRTRAVPITNVILLDESHPGRADHERHCETLLPAFKDPRYICVDGCPVFVLYQPREIP